MFDDRDLKRDLFALVLFALTVFLALALVTYNPADPLGEPVSPLNRFYQPDQLVYPEAPKVTNACGRLGAYAADLLLEGLGLGAYYLVLSLGVLDVLLLKRRAIDTPLLRTAGWAASLTGLTTLVAMFGSSLSSGPVIGAGGYLGALGRGILETHFATVGGLILAVSLVVGGLLMCTDYVLFHLALLVSTATVSGVRAGRQREASRARGKGTRTTVNDLDEEDGQPNTIAIRIRGKRVGTEEDDALEEDDEELVDEDSEEYEEDEYETEEQDELEDEEEDEEEEPAAPVKTPAKPRRSGKPRLLRFRKPPTKDERQERDEVINQLEEASRLEDTVDYELPSVNLLLGSDDVSYEQQEKEVRRKAKILERTFGDFGFRVKVVEIETGPVIAQYEVELEAGLRLSKITGLADDLAIALRVPSVRIVAPIPGKNTVGIEVPNQDRQIVRLREVMEEMNGRMRKMRIPLFLGKDVSGNPLSVDLSTLPHLLIAGRTGTGKSVCLNAIITSILMTRRPDEVRMLMIDPKMVELSGYKTLPHLMHPVVTDMRKAEAILAWAVDKMEERYELLAKAGVRHVSVYNQLGEEELMERLEPEDDEQRKSIPLHLPYVVIVADEIADLMMTSGKEVEQHIIRLAQKSRAVGIHLILATQKPTVDVITGLIKSNLPARIAFQVASRTDSRVVLDEMGAEKLLGNGDMLFLWPGTSTLLRGQGTYLSDDEINSVVDFVSTGEQHFAKELVELKVEDADGEEPGPLKKRDDLYETAVDIVVREGRGSVSLLQRSLGIGYGRAARLIDFMAEDGIVGPYAGSQAREILITIADWERMQGGEEQGEAEPEPEPPKRKRRSNKILPTRDWQDEDEPEDEEVEEDDDEAAEDEEEEDDELDADEYEEEESEDEEYDSEEYEEDEDEYDETAAQDEGDEEYDDEEYEPEDYDQYEAESA